MTGRYEATRVRAVVAGDVDAWAHMRGRLWPDAEPEDLLREADRFASGGPGSILAAAFVAVSDTGAPSGFIEVSLRAFSDGCDSMPVPHVEGWYVEPATRGRGAGRALMDAAEAWARNRGFAEIASDTEVHNEASQHAHHACGFDEVDRLVKFRKILSRLSISE